MCNTVLCCTAIYGKSTVLSLRWRQNIHDGVSNHRPHGCLLKRLFRRRSKKTSKLRVTDLCAGNSPGPVNFPHKGPVTRKMFPFDDVIMMASGAVIATTLWANLKADRPVQWCRTVPGPCKGLRKCYYALTVSLIAYTFRENRDFVFIIIVRFMMSANSRIHFGLQIVFVCLYITPSHYHHCANIELIKCTWDIHIVSSVWTKLSIFSQLSIIQYVGLCVFSLPIFLVMIERMYILCLIIIIKSEVWTISHCLGLGRETMVCAVCLSIFVYDIFPVLWPADSTHEWLFWELDGSNPGKFSNVYIASTNMLFHYALMRINKGLLVS